MSQENPEHHQEPEPSLRDRLWGLCKDARDYFGFRAPLKIEIQDRPTGSMPTARLLTRPEDPYLSTSRPFEIVVYYPADDVGREQLNTLLPFLVHHEIAHSVPRPPERYVTPIHAIPEEERRRFASGEHLRVKTIQTAVDEVVTDVLTFRSLQQPDGRWDDRVWRSYQMVLTLMGGPRALPTARFRDLLRGVTETEALAHDDRVPTEVKSWLSQWATRARVELDQLSPSDQALQPLAEDYLQRAYHDAWDRDINPKPESGGRGK